MRVVAPVLIVALPIVANAHHSRAAFDTTTEVVLVGVVADVQWKNPHTYFTLEPAGADGRPVRQEVEVGPLSTLAPLGLSKAVLTKPAPSRCGSKPTVSITSVALSQCPMEWP